MTEYKACPECGRRIPVELFDRPSMHGKHTKRKPKARRG